MVGWWIPVRDMVFNATFKNRLYDLATSVFGRTILNIQITVFTPG
jgi:hypothetical protein